MKKKKNIFVLLGHPDSDTFSGAIASAYERGVREAGHEVRRTNLGDIAFDPILHKGYKVIQELEPALQKVQEDIRWADHFVIVYPNWWCTMPALLKGMFDRMWLPGFAFNFDKETRQVIRRLAGKTARVINLSGTHSPLVMWLKFGDYTNEISRGILGFAGMDVFISSYGPCEKCSVSERERWIEQVRSLGRKGM